MSNKLTFEEYKNGRIVNNDYSWVADIALEAWNFCQAQEQKENEELKKKVEELEKTVSSQTEIIYKLENECSFTYKCPVNSNLQKENESLKKKLDEAVNKVCSGCYVSEYLQLRHKNNLEKIQSLESELEQLKKENQELKEYKSKHKGLCK